MDSQKKLPQGVKARLPCRLISDMLGKKSPVFSIEFFPPKDDSGRLRILETAQNLREHFQPDFVSITYGAGGTTREPTLHYARELREDYGFEVMPHLTCVGHSRAELLEIVKQFQKSGFRNLMVLRGDPPRDASHFQPHPQGLHYASEFVALVNKHFPEFCIGVAGYPEGHPEAVDNQTDIQNLHNKVNKGANFITTQLFYDNASYFDFVKRCRSASIRIPILPGLLPVLSLSQVQRFCKLCRTTLPIALEHALLDAGDDDEAVRQVGVEWAYQQARELLKNGAPGLHLYSLNRFPSALDLIRRLSSESLRGVSDSISARQMH